VNSDTDPNDSFTPEVKAHFSADNYLDDGLADNATLRLRGNSSRLADQKSYRLKLNKTLPLWRGETTLQLNKHPWDLTRVRNKLAFDLLQEIPHLPSLRTQFMHLTINNQDFGLFTHVEKMGKEYLANRGLPTTGNIYKANAFEFRDSPALALDTTGYPVNLSEFELVLELENDNKDHRLLSDMIAAVNDEAQSFETVFQKYFDKNNYLAWLAVNILVGNRDTSDQNFALYQPKGTSQFYFLPWDYDGAFNIEEQPDWIGNNRYAPWRLEISNWWNAPLHRRFLQNPANVQELAQVVNDLYRNYLNEAKLTAKLNAYKPLVEKYILRSPDFDYLPAIATDPTARESEWTAEYVRLATTVKKNYEAFNASIAQGKPMPFWQAAEVIGTNVHLTWDKSVDLQNDAVSYTARVATDAAFTNVIFHSESLSILSADMPKPGAGTYYLQVLATDSKGNKQIAFNSAYLGGTIFHGVLEFVVP
jgi:spore coat protein H